MRNKNNILLKSGTGELEVLKFEVGDSLYAINVIKVKEILQLKNEAIEPLPAQDNEAVRGITNIRGDVVSVIDLRYYLGAKNNLDSNGLNLSILTNFNNTKVLFVVDQVLGISRLTWKDIREPNQLMGNLTNGVINLDNNLVNFLDFEKILDDLSLNQGMAYESNISEGDKKRRQNITLALADDSPTIREILKDSLTKAGYNDFIFFNDGQQLLKHLYKIKEENQGDSILNHIQGVITDIEMPQLDGHTLTKRIKDDFYLKELPVIIFSSLINDELRHKGESVGADEQISKPEIDKLVDILDNLVI
ncbi:chemotaxis protein [Halonatronum saccharophilum]|uniref:chemotaxis protein n=1 Tax=Halonatronum saccharophilum TaxID=150060 RepID=UPI00048020EA|nr:chemotaxis protein [Halonatronum saccharophilum]